MTQAIQALHEATNFYTRDPIVKQLLDTVAWPHQDRVLLEPSCGDGQFLVAALERLLETEPQVTSERISQILKGYEVHEGAASDARSRITMTLIWHGWRPQDANQVAKAVVKTQDFLTNGPVTEQFHVIVGNPPYLRFLNVPKPLQPGYRRAVPEYAQRDLLHAFLDRCSRLLAPDGELAFVTADRWLTNSGARDLRARIGANWGIGHLERLDSQSAFYRAKSRTKGSPARVHPVAVTLRHHEFSNIALTEEPVYPGADACKLQGTPLNEVAKVFLGHWVGKDGVFFIDEATAASLPRKYLVKAIDSDELTGGRLGEVKRYVIVCDPTEKPPTAIRDHLKPRVKQLAPRAQMTPYWRTPERVHDRDLSMERLVIPRIAKQLTAIRVPAGVMPVNHNVTIVAGNPGELDALEAFINSPVANEWATIRADRLEGGYFSFVTTLLQRLPVPTN